MSGTTGANPPPYIVSKRDSGGLSDITRREYQDPNLWTALYHWNKEVIGDNANLIKPGQQLRMPPPEYMEAWNKAVKDGRIQVDKYGNATGEIPPLDSFESGPTEDASAQAEYALRHILTTAADKSGWQADGIRDSQINALANALAEAHRNPNYQLNINDVDPRTVAILLRRLNTAVGDGEDPIEYLGYDPVTDDAGDRMILAATASDIFRYVLQNPAFAMHVSDALQQIDAGALGGSPPDLRGSPPDCGWGNMNNAQDLLYRGGAQAQTIPYRGGAQVQTIPYRGGAGFESAHDTVGSLESKGSGKVRYV